MFHNFPETLKNVELLCKSANLDYLVPENQTCCGLPYFEKGELRSAKAIAEFNLNAFGENEILSASLKCEDTYTVKYPRIFNNTVSHNHCMKLASAAKGLNYLFDKINLTQADKITGPFFYVPDCAIEKTIQVKWLSKLKNAEFHFSRLENTCCGAGFCLPALNGPEAEKMTTAIITQAMETRTENIIATNEICLQQLNNIIRKNDYPVKAIHLIDLFASAL